MNALDKGVDATTRVEWQGGANIREGEEKGKMLVASSRNAQRNYFEFHHSLDCT
jgi:hypothetical protein